MGVLLLLLCLYCITPLRVLCAVDVQIIQQGDGVTYPTKGDTVHVKYTGTLADEKVVFDTSRDHGKPLTFHIGRGEVIRGLDESIMKMSLGERAKLTITPEYAYGRKGYPGIIPPEATLMFDVELIKIVK